MKLVAQRLRLRIDDDVNIARAQSAATTKEAEGKARRKLEARNQFVPALLEKLLDALLCRRAMRHVHKISERALAETHTPATPTKLLFLLFPINWTAGFNQDRE